MLLEDSIKKAIDETLPTQVANRLKDYIADNEKQKERLLTVKAELEIAKARVLELEKYEYLAQTEKAIEKTMRELQHKEFLLKSKEELNAFKEKVAQERLEDMRSIVHAVFNSNRLNYNLNLSGAMQGYGFQGPINGEVGIKGEIAGE